MSEIIHTWFIPFGNFRYIYFVILEYDSKISSFSSYGLPLIDYALNDKT